MNTFKGIHDKEVATVLFKRAKHLGIPESVYTPVVENYLKWRRCNGIDFAVDRMKNIKQLILNSVANPDVPLEVPKEVWIGKKNKFLLKGCYGQLQRIAATSSKHLRKVMMLLNLYSIEVREETTEKSKAKFKKAVEEVGKPTPEDYLLLIKEATRRMINSDLITRENRLHIRKDIKVADSYILSAYQKDHHEASFTEQIESFFGTDDGRRIMINYVNTVYMPMKSLLGFRGYKFFDKQATMGKIHRIPSPGLKDRWVCDFKKPLEHCLKPLGKRLYEIVGMVPWDITYYPEKHRETVKQRLQTGQKAYAFDLSSATDRFPWDIQHEMLKTISAEPIWSESVALYNDLIHLPAEMPDGERVVWRRGQPLGSYPSFAVFTLAHGLLIYGLNGFKYSDGDFFVHGDDLIILNDELAEKYAQALVDLDIEYSPFKTLTSNRVTEINSEIITRDAVLICPKWKPFNSKNAIESIRLWGTWVIDLLFKDIRFKAIAEKAASLPFPYGAGINPKGLPLSERLKGFEALFADKEKSLSYEGSSRTKVLSRLLKVKEFRNLIADNLVIAQRADQARADLYLKQIPEFEKFPNEMVLDILGSNLYTMKYEKSDMETEWKIPLSRPIERLRPTERLSKLVRIYSEPGATVGTELALLSK